MKTPLNKAKEKQLTRDEQIAEIQRAGKNYYYTPEQEFDDRTKAMVIEEIQPHVRSGRILELGYTNSIWTKALLEKADHLDIIEAAENHIDKARLDFKDEPRVKVIQTLFEEYSPAQQYDTVLMSGVIKHIPDDLGFLRMARRWVKPDGVVIATTPNSRSFHRRLGSYMGLETSPVTHNKRDEEVFNVHLYDRYSWRELFIRAGYDVLELKGVFLKILSTQQMMYLGEKYDIAALLDGLRKLGQELEDYAWYLMLTARPAI